MFKNLLVAGFFGAGASSILLLANNNLPYQSYLINIPIWMTIVFPLGHLWKKKFLDNINKGQFPPDMKSYKQLFLTSRKAIVYDLFLNQLFYHSFLGVTVISITYGARKIYDPNINAQSLSGIWKQIGGGFIKLRLFFASASLLSEFWGSKLALKKINETYMITPHHRKLLLLKQSILQLIWMASILNLFHNAYEKHEQESH